MLTFLKSKNHVYLALFFIYICLLMLEQRAMGYIILLLENKSD